MSNDAKMQMAVEAPHEWARVIRVAGSLDRAAAAGLLRLIDAQLDLVAAHHCRVSDLVVDLESVRGFEPGGLEPIRHARHSAGAQTVRIHLVGCSARFHLLPLRACQILAEFSTFPTVEVALVELSRAEPSRAIPTEAPAPPPVPEHRHDGPGDLGPAPQASLRQALDRVGLPPPRLSPEGEPSPARLPHAAGDTLPLR